MTEEKKGYYKPRSRALTTTNNAVNINIDIKEIRKTMKSLTGHDIFLFKINATLLGLALYATQGRQPDDTYLKLLDRLGSEILNLKNVSDEDRDSLFEAFKSLGINK